MKLTIFDLDDTLIDFASTRDLGYRRIAAHLDQQGIDSVAFLRDCVAGDRSLFVLFEQGILSRDEYRLRRFSDPLKGMGITPDDGLVEHLNTLFMECVNGTPLLFDDVLPVLGRLRTEGIRSAILTNGPSDGQRRKLTITGLSALVDHVAISEETGLSKPSPSAFHAVAEQFAVAHRDAIMVGDSPELDYDAALKAGLRALLLDRGLRHRDSGRACVRSLDAIFSGDNHR